ncbi:MAG: hypothetical protein JO112_09200 [Planctomycetes bacterium]|nr:hypothetical protein [Planctomycetota bacterium]
MWLLFNHFAKVNDNPFQTPSVNNQAMLVRGQPLEKMDRPAYWLVYEPLNDPRKPGRVKLYLDASFDASQPNPRSVQKYYPPDACANCHGGDEADPRYRFKRARLNYLDSDHWFDRVQNAEDFPELQYSPHGLVFDGTKDLRSKEFEAAFDVLRKVNGAIAVQNQAVEGNVTPASRPGFQLVAVQKWNELHQRESQPQPLLSRALQRAAGDRTWQVSNPNDVRLLAKLNQYCFRCHSSLHYDVFDKKAVSERAKSGAIRYLVEPGEMPQDRVLTAAQKAEFLDLVAKLAQEP